MELEQLLIRTETAINQAIPDPDFTHGKVSMFIKFVRMVDSDGSQMEESLGHVNKQVLTVSSYDELLRHVAENMMLAVYGAEVQLVKDMPNLIVRLFDQKAMIQTPGAPALDAPGQIYLKATVYRYEPSLWDSLFNRA
jgi:hypothetical protein